MNGLSQDRAVPSAASDSVFDEFRFRIHDLERRLREAALMLQNRNDRLLGHEGPPPHPGSTSNSSAQPVGPLVSEVQIAISSLNDAVAYMIAQVDRQGPLG